MSLDSATSPISAAKQNGNTDWVVFGSVAATIIALVLWGALATRSLGSFTARALSWLITNVGWFFVLSASGFVAFILYLAFSRFGRIPLGRDGEQPEFRTVSWIAMMFSAGMGIGLMFFGFSEPLAHFVTPPPGAALAGPSGSAGPDATAAAIKMAMATSLFHWTLHPWSIYAVAGLAIAYSSFRKGRRQLVSSVFLPLLGPRKTESAAARLIDSLALFATLFGSAASLGLGTLQIRSGLRESGWIEGVGTHVLVLIIVVLTLCFIASAVSGIAKGIQYLSNINMVLAVALAIFVFLVGPTIFILNLVPTSIGSYLSHFGEMASRTAATGDETWLRNWTIFYWAWWISWTPFVGMFIARISRGRTIREFIVGVLFTPCAVSVIWFAIFGGAAIHLAKSGADIAQGGAEAQTFNILAELPLTQVTSVTVVVLVALFFVSGADAGSVVMGTLSQRGSLAPRRWVVVFWGAAVGAVAGIMLAIGGARALSGIQNLTFIAALPFAVVMVIMCYAMLKDLKRDPLMLHENKAAEVLAAAVRRGTVEHDGDFQLKIGGRNDTSIQSSGTKGARERPAVEAK